MPLLDGRRRDVLQHVIRRREIADAGKDYGAQPATVLGKRRRPVDGTCRWLAAPLVRVMAGHAVVIDADEGGRLAKIIPKAENRPESMSLQQFMTGVRSRAMRPVLCRSL